MSKANIWETKKLRELTSKIGSGITPHGGKKSYLSEGIPLIRSQNVLVDSLDLTDVAFISVRQHNSMASTKLKPNDVLLNITGASIGRSCVFPTNVGEANVNQHVCIIRTNHSLYAHFLSAFLNSYEGQRLIFSYQAGGNREGLNFKQIGSFHIPLPPLSEQRKIASILGTCDDEITLTERLIEAKQTFKKGLMQQLLTGKMRFPGFEGEEWPTVCLKDIAQIHYGKSPNQIRDANGVYPIYGTGGIVGSTNTILCNRAAVIIGRKGTIDQPRFVEQPFWAIDTTFYCLTKDNIEIRWLYYMLDQIKLAKYNEATGVPSLSRSNLYRIKLCLPPLSEQRKIASILGACDDEITLLQRKAAALREQKKGLMQQLLTGKMRV